MITFELLDFNTWLHYSCCPLKSLLLVKMAVIKLKYFNGRGRMEAIRWVLEYAGVSYEDIRFEREQWPEQKASK